MAVKGSTSRAQLVPGHVVQSVTVLLAHLNHRSWFMIKSHACHPNFILQMRLGTLIALIGEGGLRLAVDKETGDVYRGEG